MEVQHKNHEAIISELRESLAWTDLVLSNIKEGILVIGKSMKVLYANDAIADMVGATRIALLGMPVEEFLVLCVDGKTLQKGDFQKAFGQQSTDTLAGRYEFHCNEEIRKVDITASSVASLGETVLIIRDVTQQVKSEQALIKERVALAHEQARRQKMEEHRKLLQSIIDGAFALIYLKDLDGKYVMVNSQYQKTFDIDGSDIIGKTDEELFSGEVARVLSRNDKEVVENRTSMKWEESIRQDAQKTTYIYAKFPLLDPDGNPHSICGILTDITARKELEERKDEFINIASHELKTPLASMKLFWELTQRYIKEGKIDKTLENFSKINNQLDKLTKLTDNLLNISRMETSKLELEKEEFDFMDLVQDTIETAQTTTEEHTIRLQEEVQEHRVLADKHRIGQVLLNLLTNAIKYSPGGGDIIVRVEEDAQTIRVSVQDFGIGIAREHQGKIFDRFYKVTRGGRKEFPGLGIGLYIASEIIRRHGGSMEVESKEGKGSTFSFELPLK